MSHPIPRLAASQSAVFLLNSRLGLFTAARQGRAGPNPGGRPFSRSYGVVLPSSLTWFLPSASVFSTRPPVSVCGTVPVSFETLRRFSRRGRGAPSGPGKPGPTRGVGRSCRADLPARRALPRDAPFQWGARPGPRVTPSLADGGPGMLTWSPSATPSGLALGAD